MSLFWVWLSLEHVENMAGVSTDFLFDSVIRGHHIYKKVWYLQLENLVKEKGNEHDCFAVSVMKDRFIVGHAPRELSKLFTQHDRFAVSVMKDGFIIGHAPRELSKLFTHFLNHEGEITARITGHRRLGNGLEVPCCYIFTREPSIALTIYPKFH